MNLLSVLQHVCVCLCVGGVGACAQLCLTLATPWTVSNQSPLSMRLPRQEYWNGLPFPSPRDLPNPGIKAAPPALAGGFFTTESAGSSILWHSVQFSLPVLSNSATPWTAACQACLSITNSQSLLKLMSIKSVMPSKHCILCHLDMC